jgi:thiamine-phosphate pyrophosphorylase
MGELLAARDIRFDVGKDLFRNNGRKSHNEVFMANIERAEEALRVLEEFSHILDKGVGEGFRNLRFQLYNLEKKIVARFPALSNTG